MGQIVKHTLYVFITIFTLSAVLSLVGLVYLWFAAAQKTDLPYLHWLLATVIAEIVAVIVLIARKGLRYLPRTEVNKTEDQTIEFMRRFICRGSTITIVTNRASWLDRSSLADEIKHKLAQGVRFEVITPSPVSATTTNCLAPAGAVFRVTGEHVAPEARFTLINSDRAGAEELAIARGVHPEHEITVFDSNSGPQMIAMAKDIVRKSRELANVSKME